MSDKKDKEAKPAKKGGGGMIIKIVAAVALLGAGGGGVYALVATGMIGGGGKIAIKEDKNPKLIRKGESDPYAPAAKDGEGDGKAVDGDGGSEYRTLYFSFSDDFTSNLKGTGSLVQVSIACSTHRDYRVLLWLKKHELAIRSAMLAVLADTDEEDVQTPKGKEALQRRLAQAINKVLIDAEGFGGVDAVYFKNFIIQ
jgi:flagellar FliL protein